MIIPSWQKHQKKLISFVFCIARTFHTSILFEGAVEPSPEAVHKNKYKPLSRPLFIYVNPNSSEKRYVYQFVNFYLKKASDATDSVGYVPLIPEIYQIGVVHLNKGKVGTVFGGESQFDLTIGQLLQKQKQF